MLNESVSGTARSGTSGGARQPQSTPTLNKPASTALTNRWEQHLPNHSEQHQQTTANSINKPQRTASTNHSKQHQQTTANSIDKPQRTALTNHSEQH
jgi:hypothetical protein